jgi:hypothetical protein
MATPTSRTLDLCKEWDWPAEVVERWVPFSKVRKDLFGFIDIVAITPRGIMGIQATSRSNVSARMKKITTQHADILEAWKKAGACVEVWGWGKMKTRGRDGKFWQVTFRLM